jgi:hypothetical protein
MSHGAPEDPETKNAAIAAWTDFSGKVRRDVILGREEMCEEPDHASTETLWV